MSELSISPLDGRYQSHIKDVAEKYFSEFALFKYRLKVEIFYFLDLCKLELPELTPFAGLNVNQRKELIDKIMAIYVNFSKQDFDIIKSKEKIIKHDVKALEYFIQSKFKEIGLEKYISFIHFGLTSQDINNTAIPHFIKDYIENEYMNQIQQISNRLNEFYEEWKNVVMISRTHGQPAVPTTMGKEIKVFEYKLSNHLEDVKNNRYYGKFGGAVGNLTAHYTAYPKIKWEEFGSVLLRKFGLLRSEFTTQIGNYDDLSSLFNNLSIINDILVDMCQDIWQYISMDYLRQKIIAGEVGSSTMPHKVNPISFENAEGNLGMANCMLKFFSDKLVKSRLQRDLSDSTVTRNFGVPFGYMIVAFNNILTGLDKLTINREKIDNDLNDNYVVISEGIQTILRKHGESNAYEKLRDFTRVSGKIDKASMDNFINSLDISESIRRELLKIDVHSYC